MDRQYSSKIIFIIPAIRPVLFIVTGILLLFFLPLRSKSLSDISMWWPLLCIYVNIITITILLILTRREGKGFRDIINHNPDKRQTIKDISTVTPLMLILGIGGLTGFSWIIYGYMPVTSIHPLPLWAAVVTAIFLPVTIVFSEIPLYLGYCVPRLKEKTGNDFFSIAYPLFFYALQHSFMPLLFDFKHMFSRFIMFIPLLILMGLWYSRKKDLIPLMTGHGILDLLTGIQLLIVSLYPSIYEMMLSSH